MNKLSIENKTHTRKYLANKMTKLPCFTLAFLFRQVMTCSERCSIHTYDTLRKDAFDIIAKRISMHKKCSFDCFKILTMLHKT